MKHLVVRRAEGVTVAGLALFGLIWGNAPVRAQVAGDGTKPDTVATDIKAADKATTFGHSMLGDAFNEIPRQRAYLMKGMPNVEFVITTKSKEAQKFFNQGIGQLHGFWYLEAARSFRKVVELDPASPMGYWGLAMSYFNDEGKMKEFIGKAVERKANCGERERLWVESIASYVATDPKIQNRDRVRHSALDKAWQGIVEKFPDDVEAKAFLAYFWLETYDLQPSHSQEEKNTLMNRVLAANPMHPIHHYRIHLWDSTATEKNALNSAALCGPSSPGIAHMWHMQGHTYTGLQRYDDAAYSQEASARVDHAYMMRDHVLPDEIHNYAHNNQWLIENLEYLGRAHEAVSLGVNMVDLPRHPRFNTLNYGSASSGRHRLMETLACFDLWEDTLRLNGQGYIEPGINDNQRMARLTLLADAAFATGRQTEGQGFLGELLKMQVAHAPQDPKQLKEGEKPKPPVPVNTSEYDPKTMERSLAEARAYEAIGLGNREEAIKQIDMAGQIPSARAARLRLQVGQKEKALQLAEQAVKQSNGKQVAPLATLVDVLRQSDKLDEAKKRFAELRVLAGHADLDVPLMAKLGEVATLAGCTVPDWRTPAPSPSDIGPRPALDTLGPFRWSPTAAPNFSLRGVNGKRVSLTDYTRKGRPVVVVFYLGNACARCMEQLAAFAPMKAEFDRAGIELVAISTDTPQMLQTQNDRLKLEARFPFPLLSDHDCKAFKAFRAYDDFEAMPLHGAFLIDGKGRVRWQDIRFEPFMDAHFLLEEAKRLIAQPEEVVTKR